MNFRFSFQPGFLHRNPTVSILLLSLCVVLWPLSAKAQFRASLTGTVTDPQGAVVPGAQVTLTNTATNATLTTTTNSRGVYEFNQLAPAPYRLTVNKTGFQVKVLANVTITPEQTNTVNVQLQLGQVTQTVTVTAPTYAANTENANISGTISTNEIEHLPTFGRDVFQLMQLAPGVFGDGAQGGNGGAQNLPGTQGPGATGGNQGIFQTENGPQALAVGQQYETNGISIDGISTASAVWGGTTIITPSKSSVQSVTVLSNTYDAEYGRFSGAQVRVITKSGTNTVHGSAFFTAHRPGLNAYQSFNGLNNAVLRDDNFFNQFGGSLGGPIWRNKIFAFFAYEAYSGPKAQTNISNQWADTSAFDALAPSGSIASQYLSFPGSAIQSVGINPSTCTDAGLIEGVNCKTIPGQGLNLGTPLTTPLGTQDPTWTSPSNPGIGSGLGNTADIANYIVKSTSNSSKAQYNGRLDADATSKDHIAFTLYYVPQSSNFLNGPARQYNFFHHSQVNEAFTAIWNHIISGSFLNEFRLNAAGWRWNEIKSNPQSPVGLPTDYIDTIGSISVASFGPNVGSILNQWTYGLRDVATKTIGSNTIKFGVDITKLHYLSDCAGCGVPHYNFFNLWDFLNDAPHAEGSGFNPLTGTPTTLRQDDRESIWGLFVQDNVQLRSNLTVNLGLRYNYFGPLSSKQSNMFVATPGLGATYMTFLVVRRGNSWNTQKDNWSPQIAFAWSPMRFDNKLVFRGGYGLNYNQEEIAISANIMANPGLVVFPTFTMATPSSPNPGILYAVSSNLHSIYNYPSNPNAIVQFGPNGLPTTGTVNVSIFPSTLPTMRVHHYSLQAEYELRYNTMASLGYQGSLSRNIFFHENPNATPAARGYPLNPQIGGGDYWSVLGWGNYNAMIAEVRHRFSQHFMADFQFTWAKSMDTSSGPYFEQPYPYNLNLDYGPSDYNVTRDYKLYGLWQPVIFHGSRSWLEKIAGGWTISGTLNFHSGFPWTPLASVQGGSLYCGTCGYTTVFPAKYLGGAKSSTSNDAFKTGSNFPQGGSAYFSVPTYTAFSGSNYGTALPQTPGVRRNSFTGPGYRGIDLALAKNFGIPNNRILGENAKLQIRMDAYNIFNLLNFNPGSIVNNIAAPAGSFGRAQSALAARVVTLGARFSF